MTLKECFTILEISGDDLNDKYLKTARNNALLKWHPDKAIHRGISTKIAHEKTIFICEAYEYILINKTWILASRSSQKINQNPTVNPNKQSNKENQSDSNNQSNKGNQSDSNKQRKKKEDSEPTPRFEKEGKVYFEECHVHWIKYIPEKNILIVKFESKPGNADSIYLYENVAKKTYEEYLESHDAGKFQYHKVSYSFKYRRIESEFNWSSF